MYLNFDSRDYCLDLRRTFLLLLPLGSQLVGHDRAVILGLRRIFLEKPS